MSFDWTFFDKLDEIVYVSEIETNTLVYLNYRACEVLGIRNFSEVEGKPCHEVLQGRETPCVNCSNPFLKEGEFYEWRFFNPKLGRHYVLKDTLIEKDGKKYRLELALDLTLQEKLSKSVAAYAFNESVLNKGVQLALAQENPDASIDAILEYFGRQFESERAYIFEKNAEGNWDNTYEWCAGNVVPQKTFLQGVLDKGLEVWKRSFEKGENVIIENLEKTKMKDPLMYDYLKPQDIFSLVVSPIHENDNLFGFFGVDNPPAGRLENVSTIFTITSYFLTYLLRRRDNAKQMEFLSFYDQLTGLKNRHGMRHYAEKTESGVPVGVVFCDVMGLKKVNDKFGHQKGDELLIRAAECLKEAFPDWEKFRIGGDEFLIVKKDSKEEEMDNCVEQLKVKMDERNALMAVCRLWVASMDESFDELLKEADKRMYDDKRRYYASAEKDRRKNRM